MQLGQVKNMNADKFVANNSVPKRCALGTKKRREPKHPPPNGTARQITRESPATICPGETTPAEAAQMLAAATIINELVKDNTPGNGRGHGQRLLLHHAGRRDRAHQRHCPAKVVLRSPASDQLGVLLIVTGRVQNEDGVIHVMAERIQVMPATGIPAQESHNYY